MADARTPIRWLRVVLAGFLAELATIIVITLVILAHNFASGPQADVDRQAFAARAGYYVAPLASVVTTLLFAAWAARRAGARHVLHGALVGLVAVLLSAGFVFAAEPGARLMYVATYALKLLSGCAGGALARGRG